MNDLEQWLAEVKAFNKEIEAFAEQWPMLALEYDGLMDSGKRLGLKQSKIKSMLASVKLKVEMPEEKAGT